jgi:putative GTP pyrophosphokinase
MEVTSITKAEWDKILIPYHQAAAEIACKFRTYSASCYKLGVSSRIEVVEHRVKKPKSIAEKAMRKNIPFDRIENDILDIAGVRLICRFEDDIDAIIEIIRSRDCLDMKIKEERNYINNMKQSGYRSYHCFVWYSVMTPFGVKRLVCEIQIRTMVMNYWATIEHSLRYKYDHKIPERLRSELTASADLAYALDNKINKIRNEILAADDEMKHEDDIRYESEFRY